MEDREIIELAVRLEASLVGAEGIVRSDVHFDEGLKNHAWNGRFHLIGNRAGYLQLASLFLRAAAQPLKDAETAIVDVPLHHRDISIFDYQWMERREDVEREEEPNLEPHVETWRDKLGNFGCTLFATFLCLLLVVGFFVVMRWLLSLLGM